MSIFDYFRSSSKSKGSANTARERLQIVVAHERQSRTQPDYLPQMQQDIIEVIRRYVQINKEQVNVNLDSNDDYSVLELNVTLAD